MYGGMGKGGGGGEGWGGVQTDSSLQVTGYIHLQYMSLRGTN